MRIRRSKAHQTMEGKHVWVITLSNIWKGTAFLLQGVTIVVDFGNFLWQGDTNWGFRKLVRYNWYKSLQYDTFNALLSNFGNKSFAYEGAIFEFPNADIQAFLLQRKVISCQIITARLGVEAVDFHPDVFWFKSRTDPLSTGFFYCGPELSSSTLWK